MKLGSRGRHILKSVETQIASESAGTSGDSAGTENDESPHIKSASFLLLSGFAGTCGDSFPLRICANTAYLHLHHALRTHAYRAATLPSPRKSPQVAASRWAQGT